MNLYKLVRKEISPRTYAKEHNTTPNYAGLMFNKGTKQKEVNKRVYEKLKQLLKKFDKKK